ncbi:PilX N-terminal domain-containing pilus assembly protein [Glaciimonas sp. PAMC28666]|uniref:pilus assembly PilX family protein n=1 Tax=Glaciimonas sp. PAMC28666 TaxID=2807626 RepID=UPI0019660455|nr:PilX N-terminal domain-containing pilus assembly protein [Glaciimonas sp. PAMC28666]QRX84259.1 hypothetical protein JQN73_08775 [Glaciimonas sp. PAMC28666]
MITRRMCRIMEAKKIGCLHGGLALPMTLIFLLVMTMIGLAAMRNVSLEEKIAGNLRSRQRAFEGAEQGLRYCEMLVGKLSKSPADFPPQLAMGPVMDENNQEKNHWEIAQNWRDNAVSIALPPRFIANNGPIDSVSESPRCMIEKMALVGDDEFQLNPADRLLAYRITARGAGANSNVAVILQSYIRL